MISYICFFIRCGENKGFCLAQEDLGQAPHDVLASYCVGNYLDPEDDVLQVCLKLLFEV